MSEFYCMGNPDSLPCGVCPVCTGEVLVDRKAFKKGKKIKRRKQKEPYKRHQRTRRNSDY